MKRLLLVTFFLMIFFINAVIKTSDYDHGLLEWGDAIINTQSDPDLAIAIYQQGCDFGASENKPLFFERIGDVHASMHRIDDALKHYHKAMLCNSNTALSKLLQLHVSHNLVDQELMQLIETVLGNNDVVDRKKNLLIRLYIKGGKFDEARELYFQNVVSEKERAVALLKFIQLHERYDQVDRAIYLTEDVVYTHGVEQAKPLLIKLYIKGKRFKDVELTLLTIHDEQLRKQVYNRYIDSCSDAVSYFEQKDEKL